MLAFARLHRALLLLVWLAVIGLLAFAVVSVQGESRQRLESRFQDRVTVAAARVDTFRGEVVARQLAAAERFLAGPGITGADWAGARAATGHQSSLVLDRGGRVLRATPARPGLIGRAIAPDYPHLATALSGRVAVSPVVRSVARGERIIAFAVPYDTPQGRRVFSSGYHLADTPLQGYLRNSMALRGSRFELADRHGENILFSADDTALDSAQRRGSDGHYEADGERRYFATSDVPGTPWRVSLSVPTEVLYSPVSGAATWIPWLVLALLAAGGLGGAALLTRLIETRRRLATSEAIHAAVLRNLPDAGVLLFDAELRYSLADGPALARLGLEPSELPGRSLAEVVGPEHARVLAPRYRAALAGEETVFPWKSPAGDRDFEVHVGPLRGAHGEILGGLVVARDVTERTVMERELEKLANEDHLTGLWNRRRFEEELDRQTARCRRTGEPAAVLLLDLDRFKAVNDTYGHHAGDRLLRHVAERLDARVRATDAVGRLGGDEFAVLLAGVGPDDAARVAEQIAADLTAHPVDFDGDAIPVRASVGVAFLNDRASGGEALRAADVAMYDAKAAGRAEVSALRRSAQPADDDAVRVVHVEDCEAYRRLVAEMLWASGGIDVAGGAGTFAEAVEQVGDRRPDVVLLDAGLGGAAGAETLAAVRGAAPGARVLVLSGRERSDIEWAAAADGFVAKADGFDVLADAIRSPALV